MLETIREYGHDQLDEADRGELIERHGAFYERLAADAEVGLRGRDGATWLELVEHELPNLRAAMGRALERGLGARTLRIATGLGRYWEARSSATEGRRWLDQAFAAGPVENGARSAGCFVAGHLALFQGEMAAADDSFAEAAHAAQAAGEVFLEAVSCAYLVWVARERGNHAAGEAPLERSRALLALLTDPWERSEVLLPLSCGLLDHEMAAAIMEEVVALKRETGDVIAISDSLNNVGWDALVRGDVARATTYLEEALAIARELDDTFRMTLAVGNLATTAVLQERYEEAVERSRETLLLCIRRGDRRGGSEAVLVLAAVAAGLGEDELSVKIDALARALAADAGIVYEPMLLERLEPYLSRARTGLGPERVAALEAEIGTPTVDLALELLDARIPGIASPTE